MAARSWSHATALFTTLAVSLWLAGCAPSSGAHEDRVPLGGKADAFGSCVASSGEQLCGGKSDGNCYCDDDCARIGDCCDDKVAVCGCGPDGCHERQIEVLFTAPYCDVCSTADKTALLARSPLISRTVAAIDAAQASVDATQFTFSRTEIEQALLRAHQRGVRVRLALNAAADQPDTAGRRLAAAGVEVRYVKGQAASGSEGLQHAKFVIVDGRVLLSGSNNWSSTGMSINEEHTVVVEASADDALVSGFACHFEVIWEQRHADASACNTDEVAFTPGSVGKNRIRDEIRASRRSIDILMHHLAFTDLVKELAVAQERGVQVRLVVNEADRAEYQGAQWTRLFAAGGQIRFKRGNTAEYQLMHHKLAIIDGAVVLAGSGNWSGSAFFNNFENFTRLREPHVVRAFEDRFAALWTTALSASSIAAGKTAAQQHADETRAYFGNLHAHYHAEANGRLLDDGHASQRDAAGVETPVDTGATPAAAARYAFEYGRDRGGLDFMALSPHCTDDSAADQASMPNIDQASFTGLGEVAAEVTASSSGGFVALAGMEWSTNSTGNHVNVLGTRAAAKVLRGRFDLLFEGFLRGRRAGGERPLVMFNHPRTFASTEDGVEGNWDQLFGVPLTSVANGSERKNKFNDYGLDDYPPLRDVRDTWLSGAVLPDPAVVDATLANVWASAAPYARLMEVTLGRGTEIGDDIARNPSLVEEAGQIVRRTKVESDWNYYLVRGFRLAPAASHDNHYANWGTGHTSRTGVVAPALTEAALLEAIDRRAVFASEDENLSVRFYAADRVPMGGETATVSTRVPGSILIEDPDYTGPYQVRILRGRLGEGVTEMATLTLAQSGWLTFDLELLGRGQHFFYVEVLEVGANRMAWTAPIWIEGL